MDVRPRQPTGLKVAVATLLLALQLASCTTWKTQTVPPPAPSHVRLVMAEGPSVELWQARVVADSLVGFLDATGTLRGGVPVAKVKQVQTRGVSAGKTATLGIVGGAIVGFYIWCLAFDGCQK